MASNRRQAIDVVLELASFSLMFELKLGSGFDNVINLVALAKVISFHVRSKNCDQKCYYAVGRLMPNISGTQESSQLVIVECAGAYDAVAASR